MEKRWALVTGASSGIGFAYSEELASRGSNLVMVSNEKDAIEEKGKHLAGKYGVKTLPLYRDLAIPGAAKELHETCVAKDIEIEVLINNAGMFYFMETLQAKDVVVEKMLYLHLTTPTQLCYYFGNDMKRRRHGYILNMSSLSCWLPFPGINQYAATKRYLKNFSRGLRTELKDYGVGVTVLCPGAVATNLYNLSDNLKNLAINLGIMMRPERLAKIGIKAMFKRRSSLVPGLINKIFTPLVMLLPNGLVLWVMRKTKMLKFDN